MITVPAISITHCDDKFRVALRAPQLRILQVTDLHFSAFGPLDRLGIWMSARALVRRFNVDLVACTGDLFGLRTVDAMKKTARLFGQIMGVEAPWLFAWGNHDQELRDLAQDPLPQLDQVEEFLEHLPGCIYKQSRAAMDAYPGPVPLDDPEERDACSLDPTDMAKRKKWDGFYGGNYQLEVTNEAGALAWNVFVLNSRRWHHVPPKVLKWLKDRVRASPAIPSVCFYHVPNWEFHDIWERGIAKGIKREAVCFERDHGRFHAALKELGTIKACFVGHDHVNDYHGMLDGINYVYGRKTCLGGYGSYLKVPDKFKDAGKAIRVGAKLITLQVDAVPPEQNTLDHFSVFHDGTTWRP